MFMLLSLQFNNRIGNNNLKEIFDTWYIHFESKINNGTNYARTLDALMFDADHIEKALHCTPACKRIEYSAKPFSVIRDPTMTDKLEVEIYFAKDKFPVNEQYYTYDGTSFIADFGSYLGLLLGYSMLAFFDTLMHLFKTILEKCNVSPRKDK